MKKNIRHMMIIAAFCFLVVLSGCMGKQEELREYQFVDEGESSCWIELPQYCFDFSVAGDKIYLLGNDNISFYSGNTGRVVKLIEKAGNAIAVCNHTIALLCDNEILLIDDSGRIMESCPLNTDKIIKFTDIIINDSYIVFTGLESDLEYKRNRLFCIDRKSGALNELEAINTDKAVYAVSGLDFLDEETIVVSAKVTLDFYTENNIMTVFDLKKENIEYESRVPYSSDVNCVNGNIYYANEMKLCRYSMDQNASTILRSYKEEYLSESSGTEISLMGRMLDVTENNIMYLFPLANMIYVDCLEYANEPIRILAPKSESRSLYEEYEAEFLAFITENKTQIEVTELPSENYIEKINLKLMSKDTDFDYCLVVNADKTHNLNGILEKKMYHSLNDYESVSDILSEMYDGIHGLVSYEGDIYGMPIAFVYMPLLINREVFEKYNLPVPSEDWTYDDVWELCDKLKDMDSDVRIFSNDVDLFWNMLESWGENYYGDSQKLYELVDHFLTNMESGVLAFENGDGSSYSYHDDKEYLFATFHEFAIPYYDTANDDVFRWPIIHENDPNIGKMSKVLIMNPETKNAELASGLLTYLYRNDSFRLFFDTGLYGHQIDNLHPELLMNSSVADKVLSAVVDSLYEMDTADICQSIIDTIDYIIKG